MKYFVRELNTISYKSKYRENKNIDKE